MTATVTPRTSVPTDILEQVRSAGLNRPNSARTLRRVAGHSVVYIGAIATAEVVGKPLAWAAAWLLCGLVLLGCLAASHEAVHNNLFPGKAANRVAGNLLAGVAGVPWAAYRAYHLAHHADTRGPGDPEPQERIDNPGTWFLAMLLGGAVYLVQQWVAVVRTVVGRPPHWAAHRVHRLALRRTALASVVVLAAIAVGISAESGHVVRWWVIPMVMVWCGLGSFVAIPEHHGLPATGDALTSTRTTRSNGAFRWLFWNNNLHTAHHLLPSVPWHQLDVLDEIIRDRSEHIASGYVSYHRGVILGR